MKTRNTKSAGGGSAHSANESTGGVWLRRLLWVALAAAGVAVIAAGAMLSYYGRDLPTVESLKSYAPKQVTRITDRKGLVLAELFEERRTVVPMEKIPRALVLAVLAAEDADFYRHRGLDYAGIFRAVLAGALQGRPTQGGSTITQQLVKNLLLSSERTFARKVRELILARRLEQSFSKDEILHLYLNHINFGHGRYGVQEAARYYFGKDVGDLSLAEASLIAGIPQSPARLAADTHPEAARRRQSYVLDQLLSKRVEYWPDLSEDEIAEARAATPTVVGRDDVTPAAPEVVAMAKRTLAELVGADAAALGGYTIVTTLDLRLQKAARTALREGLSKLDRRHKLRGPLKASKRTKRQQVDALKVGRTYDAWVVSADDAEGTLTLDVGGHRAIAQLSDAARFNPDRLPASQFAAIGAKLRVSVQELHAAGPAAVRLELGPQGAVVLIDPRSRDVLALVGGDDASFGFNRALDALRQPGSTFKPIVYALGLKSRRFTPASLVLDAPEVYDQWQPANYETWHYEGAVRLRQALAKSINLVAVRVMSEVTPDAVVSFARDLGITTPLDPSLSLALGASEVRPIELVNAYATFAAGGRYVPYRVIARITDRAGRDVPMPPFQAPRDVMTAAEAYMITSMLTSVVQEGTAQTAQKLKRPAAGKTGTSNNVRDAWFVGFTPEVAAGVWIGYDDGRSLGRGESGSAAALPIWIDVVGTAVKDKPVVQFAQPSGVTTLRIDPTSGLLAYEGMETAIDEIFLEDNVPTETASPPDVIDSTTFLLEQMGQDAPKDPMVNVDPKDASAAAQAP